MFDFDALASHLLKIVGEPIKKLAERIKAIEDRKFESDIQRIDKAHQNLFEIFDDFSKKIEAPNINDIKAILIELVAGLPKPQDGKSVSVDEILPIIDGLVEKKFSTIELPKPIELPDVPSMVRASVRAAIAELPKPQDGKDGATADQLKGMVQELVSVAIEALPKPKDGIGLAGAVLDREGSLVITLSDGKMANLGTVVAKELDLKAIHKTLEEMVKAIPRPKDGLDGFGFDDLSYEFDGVRNLTFKFEREGKEPKVLHIQFPTITYKQVYVEGKKYDLGDLVTWGGSMWHCNKNGVTDKPGSNDNWTLAVKRGRDGKEVVTIPPNNGPVKK